MLYVQYILLLILFCQDELLTLSRQNKINNKNSSKEINQKS